LVSFYLCCIMSNGKTINECWTEEDLEGICLGGLRKTKEASWGKPVTRTQLELSSCRTQVCSATKPLGASHSGELYRVSWYVPHTASPLSTFHTTMLPSSRPPRDTRYLLSQVKVTDSTRTLWISYLDTICLVSHLHKMTYAWNMTTSHECIHCSPQKTQRQNIGKWGKGCKIWGFHGGDYEECCLLGYKNPVRTSQETHYISTTSPSSLMPCKIWCFHSGDYEECRLLGCYAVWLL
jgi:hypothetical protein